MVFGWRTRSVCPVDDQSTLTWRAHVEPAIGKLPLAGATALASKFLFQSSNDPRRSKKSLKNVENDRGRRDVAHVQNSRRRHPPNPSSYRRSQESPPTVEKKHRARENSQPTRGQSMLSPPKTPQRSRDSSAESGHTRRWKKPIKEEKGYDSGYASGSDQTSDRRQLRRGPRRPLGAARRSG